MSIHCLCGKQNKKNKTKSDPLLTILTVLFIVILIVATGTIGFRIFAHQEWIDAFVNGSLVFTDTSLIAPVHTYEGKIFMSIYNIISGVFILVLLGIVLSGGLDAFKNEIEEESHCSDCCYCNCHKDIPNAFDLLDTNDQNIYRSNI